MRDFGKLRVQARERRVLVMKRHHDRKPRRRATGAVRAGIARGALVGACG